MRLTYPVVLLLAFILIVAPPAHAQARFFPVQSVDTMKLSRDRARQDLSQEYIDEIVFEIAKTGATHVAIGTPYDEEFYPVVAKWVAAARKNHMLVWFRGNAAGWEGWFEYKKIDRRIHTLIINNFILSNPTLFEDGDIFVSCPECENGGPGDPRKTGDIVGHRAFLIAEYGEVRRRFADIKKLVTANYYSMNGDVAKLIMDRETTKQLGGIITIDHYVRDIPTFIEDIRNFHNLSGGRVVLGEWGAPIPDIHGEMNDSQQATYVRDSLKAIRSTGLVEGINYWTDRESSTSLWHNDGSPKPGVASLTSYFKPPQLVLQVTDMRNHPLRHFKVLNLNTPYDSGDASQITIPFEEGDTIRITKPGFNTHILYPHLTSEHTTLAIQLSPARTTILDELFTRIDTLFRIFSFF